MEHSPWQVWRILVGRVWLAQRAGRAVRIWYYATDKQIIIL